MVKATAQEQERQVLENISALFDAEDLPAGQEPDVTDPAVTEHMNNWSVIGSALRHELPPQVDFNFAAKVMARIQEEEQAAPAGSKTASAVQEQPLPEPELAVVPAEPVDQSTVQQDKKAFRPVLMRFKKAAFFVGQFAVAASVAMVTIVGWQTYSAGVVPELADPASNAVMGPVSGLNLASYQNDGHDMVINLDQATRTQPPVQAMPDSAVRADNAEALKQMQQQELERINTYVRGYVQHAAGR